MQAGEVPPTQPRGEASGTPESRRARRLRRKRVRQELRSALGDCADLLPSSQGSHLAGYSSGSQPSP
eukprot:11157142-Alexandrium_andersonii.AAC.1